MALAGGVLLVVAVGQLVSLPSSRAAGQQQEVRQPPNEAPEARGANAERGEADPTTQADPGPATPDPAIDGAPLENITEAPTPEMAPEVAKDAEDAVDTGDTEDGVGEGEPSYERMALASDDSGQLIAAAQTDPAAGRLVLELTAAFNPLGEEERRHWAERWRQRAESLGYEELELRSPTGRLLGRTALVGSGMIVLEPERAR